jgi:hypothetical protein
MKKIWEKAYPWQKDEVEQYKIDESKTAEEAGDEMGEDEQQKVTRLQKLIVFVTSHTQRTQLWDSSLPTCSSR